MNNLTKAFRAEGAVSQIHRTVLREEIKTSLGYADFILSEVRHATQMAAEHPRSKESILERLWMNVIENRA